MKTFAKIVSWKKTILLSIILIVMLSILGFYGLYTNTFPVLKTENFIFPFVSMVHLAFLYVLWFKIREEEDTDPQMRILEYVLYGVVVVYLFKIIQTFGILSTQSDFSNHVMPSTFLPMGIFILILQIFLIGLTFLAIYYRKSLVGDYKFDDLNQHIDSWE